MWLENHTINNITDGQDHAYPLGDPKCGLEITKFQEHPPGTSYNMFCKIDKVSDSVFCTNKQFFKIINNGSKDFCATQKTSMTMMTVMLVMMPLMLLSFVHFVSLMMLI
jgi:hypothetical protein